MTGQHDQQDEILSSQMHNQSGHCPLTGRYFEPCAGLNLIKVRQHLNVLSKRHDALCLRSMTLLQLLGKIMASFAVLGALFLEWGGTE